MANSPTMLLSHKNVHNLGGSACFHKPRLLCGHNTVHTRHSHLVEAVAAPTSSRESRGPSTSLQGPPTWTTELDLPTYEPSKGQVELIVAGAGPSGLAVAERVSNSGEKFQPEAAPDSMRITARSMRLVGLSCALCKLHDETVFVKFFTIAIKPSNRNSRPNANANDLMGRQPPSGFWLHLLGKVASIRARQTWCRLQGLRG